MARLNFGRHSGIVVDACTEHGTWFDRGELDAAIDFVRAGGIEGDVDAAPPPPSADEAAMMGQLQTELRADRVNEARSIAKGVEVANGVRIAIDLLAFLFGLFGA